MKKVLVLGATGSVGLQALDVAEKEGYVVTGISANRDAEAIERAARKFSVLACAMADEKAAQELRIRLADTSVRIYSGANGIEEMIEDVEFDVAVNSILGMAGLRPSIAVCKKGKRLALANKETMVIAGEIVNRIAKENGAQILPVDSEHCAIHQCLKPGNASEVARLWLTASGGPFFGKTKEDLAKVTLKDALAHPTWSMGAKITVDSATLMNKGMEVIEACRLFDVSADNVSVVVHRQSIIHSMVEFCDGSVIAQLSYPDMRFCVAYAVNYPERHDAVMKRLDVCSLSSLTFAPPDTETFPLLSRAYRAASVGGAAPCVLNAVNEVSVAAFLKEKISFVELCNTVLTVTEKLESRAREAQTLEEILAYDALARSEGELLIR